MKGNKKILVLLILLVFVMSLPVLCLSNQWKLLIRVKGKVQSKFAGANVWQMVWQSRMLKDGDRARTLEDSRAKIRLADQSVVTIGENTEVEMSQFKLKKTSRLAKIKLFFGKIRVRVGRFTGRDSKFEVKTPNAVLAARGTEFFASYNVVETDATGIIVFEGKVQVSSQTEKMIINAGESAIIRPDGSIMLNPRILRPRKPGAATGIDADMREYKPSATGGGGAPASEAQIPKDPSMPSTGHPSPTGTTTSSMPGSVMPPPGETGNVTVIIVPQ